MLDNYCIRCGSPITDRQARFCAGCGNQLRTAPPSGISRGGVAAIIVASVSALALIGGVAGFMVWLTGDHAHTTHGVRFHEADFDVQTASDLDAYRAGADWMVRLTPQEGAGGQITIYGAHAGSHSAAVRAADENFPDMENMARQDRASAVQGPQRVSLPTDSAAMKETWQSSQGGGRYYTVAVGSQVIMLVCFDSPKAKPDVLRQCDRIAETITPAPAG